MDDFPIDEPQEIIEGMIRAQRLLLTGFKGNPKVKKEKWKDAQNPNNAAISLAGEPTLYPKIGELIEEFHKKNFSTFLVTNGTRPDRLKNLSEEPTQLYISLCAPDEETYLKVHRPLVKDGWKKLNESLELMNSLKCRTVIRLTLVKELNMKNPKKYAKLIEKANPMFIEVKGYMWVGESQKRLPKNAMPFHEDVFEFANKISEFSSYEIKDDFKPSRVILLTRK